MDNFERELRQQSRSWKAIAGATVTTAVLFLLIASTSIGIPSSEETEAPPLTYAYVPPPPVTPREITTPPVSSQIAETFKFDPTVTMAPPDVPLDPLEIRLNPSVDPVVGIALDMQDRFEVQKPGDINVPFAFDIDQVDEVPVWTHGPSIPRLPNHLRRVEADVLVLYQVTDRGRTENVYILDTPDPAFSEPTIEMIERWNFRPGRRDGEPVRIWVQQLLNFRPQSTSPFSI